MNDFNAPAISLPPGPVYTAPAAAGLAHPTYRNQVFSASVPLWMIPAGLHAQAQRWEKLEEQTETAEKAWDESRRDFISAPARDFAATKAAVRNGEPDPGPAHALAAAANLSSSARFHDATIAVADEEALALLRSLRKNREAIVDIAQNVIPAKVAGYRAAIAKAQILIQKATEDLAEPAGILALIKGLDSGEASWLSAGTYDLLPVPEWERLSAAAVAIERELASIGTPGTPAVQVVLVKGVAMTVKADNVDNMISNGATLVPLY